MQGIEFELDIDMVVEDDDIHCRISYDRKLGRAKAHLLNGKASASASVDSARQNLAAAFVNKEHALMALNSCSKQLCRREKNDQGEGAALTGSRGQWLQLAASTGKGAAAMDDGRRRESQNEREI
ncbi:hypothetical protein LWI28_027828 [Acer negundo]|uniref:Uncharacterized protein n=1 Tax=Acer negundo TaxID=4023 RepID=A0AAD5IGT7_ACENE|nr:hypothetical protein LWI28_027828 [Acer negundo]